MKIFVRQQEEFARALARDFEERMMMHLSRGFARYLEGVSTDDLRARVRRGVARAAGYGVVSEYDVRRYLEHATLYGEDFDSDPRTPWAGAILRDGRLRSDEKMDRLDDHDALLAGAAR